MRKLQEAVLRRLRRDERAMTIERMFIAVTLPPAVVDAISDLPTRPLRGVSYTKRSQWHITLRFLGPCDRHEAIAALSLLEAPTAQVEIGPQVSLLGDRVVMIPVGGLDEVAAAVDRTFAQIGEPSDRHFVGHLTLARLKGVPLRDPSRVSVLGAPISSTFSASSVSLFETEVTPQGATHTLVATRTLN